MAQQLNGWGRGTWGQLSFGEGDLPVAITGVTTGTTAVGTLVAAGFAVQGVSGTASTVGLGEETVTGDANVFPTNVIGTTALSSVGIISNNILPITLGAATGSITSLTTIADANVFVDNTDVLATGVLGKLLIWSLVDDSQTPNYSTISTTQSPDWSEVA